MTQEQEAKPFAPASPTLSPQMILPRFRTGHLPFPFNDQWIQYFYLGRNAVYALARYLGLARQELLFPAYFEGVELEALLCAGVGLRYYPVREQMRVHASEVASQIGPHTRGIYVIHYLGFPGPLEELCELCRQRGLLLIEDCALALLSRLGERPLGSFGDAAIFSIHKTLPVPNGGALVLHRNPLPPIVECRTPSLVSTIAHTASSLSLHFELRGRKWAKWFLQCMKTLGKRASVTVGTRPVPLGTYHFEKSHADLGMSRLSRLVIAAQDFSSIVRQRRHNYLQLLNRLGDLAPPVFHSLSPGVCPLFYALEVEQRGLAVQRLLARGVEAVSFWSQEHPALPKSMFPEVERLRRTVMALPCHQDLDSQAIDRMADQVREVVRNLQ